LSCASLTVKVAVLSRSTACVIVSLATARLSANAGDL
jgi:hypothetical protein